MKKVIFISGGSDGLGYEIAKTLSLNHIVIISAPDATKLEKAAKELGCEFEICDVSKSDAIEAAVKAVVARHKKIDCLINNAGIWIEGKYRR